MSNSNMTATAVETLPKPEHEVHPAASIFPMLDAESFGRLKEDIRKHGQLEATVLLGGLIIDGRNRYRACRELGIEPIVCELEECDDPVAYVLSTNLHRRQLQISQRAMCAAQVAALSVGKPSKSANLRNYTAEQAADLFGVSARTVESARKILRDGCPELVELCVQGESVATGCEFISACKGKKEQSAVAKRGWQAIADRAKRGKQAAKPVRLKVVEATEPDEAEVVVVPSVAHAPVEAAVLTVEPTYPYTCPNCGGHEADDDGDCAKCHEPAPITTRSDETAPAPPKPDALWMPMKYEWSVPECRKVLSKVVDHWAKLCPPDSKKQLVEILRDLTSQVEHVEVEPAPGESDFEKEIGAMLTIGLSRAGMTTKKSQREVVPTK